MNIPRKVIIIFWILLIFAVGVRLYKIDLPLTAGGASRQIQTADITRNLSRDGYSTFFYPRSTFHGKEKVNFIVEFPIYNAAIVLFYSFFGEQEIIGRLFSVIAWIIQTFILFLLIKETASRRLAWTSILFSSFIPIGVVMSRNFQPDQLMLTCSIAAFYLLFKSLQTRSNLQLFFGSILFTSALLIKPTSMYLFFPVTYLFFKRYGWSFFFQQRYIFMNIIAFFPNVLWRWHASQPQNNPLLSRDATNLHHWISPTLYFNPDYYRGVFNHEFAVVLTSAGVLLFLLGITRLNLHVKDARLFLSWLFGCGIVLILFQKHAMTHEYYHLIMVPIVSVIAGIGYEEIMQLIKRRHFHHTVMMSMYLLIPIYFLPTISSRAYYISDKHRYVIETARAIQRVTPDDAVIIGSAGSDASLLYYADRSGWSFLIDRNTLVQTASFWGAKEDFESDTVRYLEDLRMKGAEYFAAANKKELLANKNLYQHLENNYTKILEEENYIIFSIEEGR